MEEGWGIAVGDHYCNLFKIRDVSSGTYIIPSFSRIGLHLSFHPPNSANPLFHFHIRDNRYGLHEDIELDGKFLSKDYWIDVFSSIEKKLQRGFQPNLDDEQIVFAPNISSLTRHLGNSSYFDIRNLLNARFFVGQSKRLPSLLDKLNVTYPEEQIYGCNSIGLAASGQIFIPIDPETIYELCFSEMLQSVNSPELHACFSNSMRRAESFLRRYGLAAVFNTQKLAAFIGNIENQIDQINSKIEYF